MVRLIAEERLIQIINIGIGLSGNQKAIAAIQREASGGHQQRLPAPSPAMLEAMGFKYEKVTRG